LNCQRLRRREPARCKRGVYGLVVGFLLVHQRVGRRWRRRRKHQGCIGCEERHNQRRANLTTVSSAEMGHQPISSLHKSIFWFGRIGSSRPGRAVSCLHGAQGRVRRGRHTTGPSELDDARPPLDRPSTVLRLREAVPILGMVPARASLSCGRDRRPSGPRPAASGQAGLGRAANKSGPAPLGRAPRGRAQSSPFGRGAAQTTANMFGEQTNHAPDDRVSAD
jgi:hypothetical protein